MSKLSLRSRIANKLKTANQTGTVPDIKKREKPFLPKLIRKPRAGFTGNLLQQAKSRLKPVDNLGAHPDLDQITVKRGGMSAHEYTDLTRDVRTSMSTLMSKRQGNTMLTELNQRIGENKQNIGDMGGVHISITKPSDTSNMNSPHTDIAGQFGDYSNMRQGYRFDGKVGSGWGSEVRINPNEATANRFIGLGHELVHAHRLAHGKAVGVPQLMEPDNTLYTDPISHGAQVRRQDNRKFGEHVRDVVQTTAHLQEEFETVGLSKTPGGGFSENMLRTEHGRPKRLDYSGSQPGKMDQTIKNTNKLFDNRNFFKSIFSKAPTPVSNAIKRYKD